jgi:hypothetical protein
MKETKKARVLFSLMIQGAALSANDLVVAEESVIDHHVKKGDLDDSPAAVRYCEDSDSALISLLPKVMVVTDQMIIDASSNLDPNDDALWTKDGKPDCKAIAFEIGEGVTVKAADRDAAWAIIQEESE